MVCKERDGQVRISLNDDFDPVKIFECGQCFRWNMGEDGAYYGIARGVPARISKEDGNIVISGTENDFRNIWYDYFDLSRDYSSIRKAVSIDGYMKNASDFGEGIRILNQDRWEALCSFIISQCNNIPRIKKIIETMCALFGEKRELEGREFFTFPSAVTIAALTEKDLAPLRCGYRAPYIIGAARAVAAGEMDLDALSSESFGVALKALKGLNGVGDKVANCVILFGLHMDDAFPIDVWMKKAIGTHYPEGLDPAVFGGHAGLAQQYMFYYQRSGAEDIIK